MKREKILTSLLIGIIGILLCIILVMGVNLFKTPSIPEPDTMTSSIEQLQPQQEREDFENEDFENKGVWYGLCKKNSVKTVNDFYKTVMNDKTLKSHYADFQWSKAIIGTLTEPTWVNVFYRKGDTIFRKDKQILLPIGDEYITDGLVMVRKNCCNRYTTGEPLFSIPPEESTPPTHNETPSPPARDDKSIISMPPVSTPPSSSHSDWKENNWSNWNPYSNYWGGYSHNTYNTVKKECCEKECKKPPCDCPPPPPPPPPPPLKVPDGDPPVIMMVLIGISCMVSVGLAIKRKKKR